MHHRFARALGRGWGRAIRALPGLLRDAAGLCGAGATAYGAWQVYAPAGFIVGGGLLVAGAWLDGRSAVVQAPAE